MKARYLHMESSSQSNFEQEALPFSASLYRTARRWTHSESDSSDLVQETFLRAYRTFHNFEPGTNCKQWLFTILRSIYVNKYRQSQRKPTEVPVKDIDEVFEERLDTRVWDAHDSVFKELGLDWQGSAVRSALRRMSEPFRTAILLVDVEEFSYEEAAGVMDCPVGTLRSRLFRARKTLALSLQEYAREMGYLSSSHE